MITHSLETVYVSSYKPVSADIVCVHGYGATLETTWHHDETGKTWIDDEDFLVGLKRPVRVLSFNYNGALAANLLPATITFHAYDLLETLEQALQNFASGKDLFFVAHGFGGLIVKRAIQIAHATSYFPKVRRNVAGVVFFGTPHASTDSQVLLRAVRQTAALLKRDEDEIPEEEIRGFAAAVAKINEANLKVKTSVIKTYSYWETECSTINVSAEDSYEDLIITEDCKNNDLVNNEDITIECDHAGMPSFRDQFDPRWTSFRQDFIEMMDATGLWKASTAPVIRTPLPSPPISRPSTPSSRSPSPSPSPAPAPAPIPTPPSTDEDSKKPAKRDPPKDTSENGAQQWKSIELLKEEKADRERFLFTLKDWAHAKEGAALHPTPGTCEWFKDNRIFNTWMNDPGCFSLFCVGEAGQGKSYLASAIATYIKEARPGDQVLEYHCNPRESRRPALWEYFTWSLIQERPSWFRSFPSRYCTRPEGSPPFTAGELAEMWAALQSQYHNTSIYLVVDGLEQCGDDIFREYMDYFYYIRQQETIKGSRVSPWPRGWIPTVKLVFTCRNTNSVLNVSALSSLLQIPKEATRADISLYVDDRVPRIAGMEKAKEGIKENAGIWWPYAKFSLDEIAEKDLSRFCSAAPADNYIPYSLGAWYAGWVLPILHSVDNNGTLRAAIIFLACVDEDGLIHDTQLEDAMQSLCPGNHPIYLLETLHHQCGNLIRAPDPDPITFIHPSLKDYIQQFFTKEQATTNVLYVCLKYLLQDVFTKRMPLSWTDKQTTRNWLSDNFPFYSFAAMFWVKYVSELEEIDESLKPLLRSFLAADSPHYRTWNHWRAWVQDETEQDGLYKDPTAMPLLASGCLRVLEFLLPPPGTVSKKPGSWADKAKAVFRPSSQQGEDEGQSIVPNWPNVINYRQYTPFTIAARNGDLDQIRYLLKWPIDINARNPHGRTHLMECASMAAFDEPERHKMTFDMCRELLHHGANVNIPDHKGGTALHRACKTGNLPLAMLLLDHGAKLNVSDMRNSTPFERACVSRNIELVEELIQRGAEVDAWWSDGQTPLTSCIINNALDVFQAILPYADVNVANYTGFTPLHVAAREPKGIEFLRLLLRESPDIDIVQADFRCEGKKERFNALFLAVEAGNYVAAEILLQAGAYPGQVHNLFALPLYHAVRDNRLDLAELLLEYGAPVNDFDGRWIEGTVLAEAAGTDHEEMVALLLRYGADPTTEDGFDALGPLHMALHVEPKVAILKMLLEAPVPADVNFIPTDEQHILMGPVRDQNAEVVKLLLEYGLDASIWIDTSPSYSPLHKAAQLGFLEGCELLLQHAPQWINAQFEEGHVVESPLHKACLTGHSKIVRLLLDRGAKPDLRNHHFGDTPLLLASDGGNYDTIKMILEAAPETINLQSHRGETPLTFAGLDGDLKVIEMLLKAGADFRIRDVFGTAFVAVDLFRTEGHGNKQPSKILDLLMQHGMDINEIHSSCGETALSLAICHGNPRDVVWILEHGADPLRCERGPGAPEIWRTALQVAATFRRADMVELLMEERWGLREHMGHEDWLGMTVFPLVVRSEPEDREVVEKLFSLSAEIGAADGHDVCLDLMQGPGIAGLSAVDYALGRSGIMPAAQPNVNEKIISLVDEILHVQRTRHEHICIIQGIALLLLLQSSPHDSEAITLITHMMSAPVVRRDDTGYCMAAGTGPPCHGCGGSIYEALRMCRLCRTVWCTECKGDEKGSMLHQHVFLEVPLTKEPDFDAVEVQDALQKLHDDLSLGVTTDEAPQDEVDRAEDVDELQSSLQLATLHYLGYLEIHRPAWTPFVPLARHVEAFIAPWMPMMEERRWFVERRNLHYEMSAWRRFNELQYFRRGMRRAYVDEELVLKDMVLLDLRSMFMDIGEKDIEGAIGVDREETQVTGGTEREEKPMASGRRPSFAFKVVA